jgi:hypothetical protein
MRYPGLLHAGVVTLLLAPIPIMAEEGAGPQFRGLTFGADVTTQVPECPKEMLSRGFVYTLETTTCWKRNPSCEVDTASERCLKAFMPDSVAFVDSLRLLIGDSADIIQQDNKLVGITFDFRVDHFADIAALFRTKYGKPLSAKRVPWQSKGGVRTTAQDWLWQWHGLLIGIKAPGNDIDHGIATIDSLEWRRSVQKKNRETLRKGLGDL